MVFLLAWTITSSSLVVLHAVNADAAPSQELLVLTGANILATLATVRPAASLGIPRSVATMTALPCVRPGPSKSRRCESPRRPGPATQRGATVQRRATARQLGRWMPRHVAGFLRGPAADPAWERPALVVLLAFTTLLYTWGLDRNGWANSYYSAAAMSGSQDWTAFLFGSSEPGNAITRGQAPSEHLGDVVVRPRVRPEPVEPAPPPSRHGRRLRVSAVPHGPKTVRCRRPRLLAGAFLAVIPVATVMFRYNNPDALLTLLMIGIAYCTLEAIDRGQPRLAADGRGADGRRAPHQTATGPPAAAVHRAGLFPVRPRPQRSNGFCISWLRSLRPWWLAGGGSCWSNSRTPRQRPFIGGSRNNSVIELTLGYNGLDRLTGEDASRTMVRWPHRAGSTNSMSASSGSCNRSSPARAGGSSPWPRRVWALVSGASGGARLPLRPGHFSCSAASGLPAP